MNLFCLLNYHSTLHFAYNANFAFDLHERSLIRKLARSSVFCQQLINLSIKMICLVI